MQQHIAPFKVGDIISIHQKITEGDKTRIQIFEGIVLAIKGRGENRMFTVRKMVGDIGIEKIFPFASPLIAKVEVKTVAKKKLRRAKLYNLRISKK